MIAVALSIWVAGCTVAGPDCPQRIGVLPGETPKNISKDPAGKDPAGKAPPIRPE